MTKKHIGTYHNTPVYIVDKPLKDPNIIYPGKDQDFVFPEEGSDMPKRFSKEQTHYVDDHGSSNEQCSKCEYYVNPTTCEIVVGKINPDGWCNKFERAE